MRNVSAFPALSEPVALNRARQDHGRTTTMPHSRVVGRIHFEGIVPAEPELGDLLVRQMLDHIEQPRIFSEQVLTNISARLDGVLLPLTVDSLTHPFDQQSI